MEMYRLRQIKFLENGEITEKCGGIKRKFSLINEELFMKHCYFWNVVCKLCAYVNSDVKIAVV